MIEHKGLNVTGEATVGPFYIAEGQFHTVCASNLGVGETIDIYTGRDTRLAQFRKDGEDKQLTPDEMALLIDGPFKYYLHKGATAAGILVESYFDGKESFERLNYQG